VTTKLGTLTVDLLAKTGSFETDIKRAEKTTASSMRAIGEAATQAGALIGAGLAAGATAAAVAVKQAIDQADEISKLSQKIGITTEALSGLNVAAQLSDVGIQQLQGGITRLVRAQEDVASGAGNMASLFDAIGVSAVNADGSLRETDKVLRDLADVFQALPDGAAKTALAVDIFGRSGADLIPLLNEGSKGLREYDELAERLGVRLSTETGKAAEDFNDNLTILKIGLQGVATQVATELLPDLVDLTNQFTATDNKAKDIAESVRSVTTFFGGLADVAAIVKNTIEGVILASIQLGNNLQGLANIANPFEYLLAPLTGSNPVTDAERNFREADTASRMAAEAFGRAGRRITGDDGLPATAPEIEFITPETLAASDAGAGRDPKALEDALRERRKEQERAAAASKAAGEADRLFAQAQRDAAHAAAELQRAVDERDRAAADFQITLEDYRAEIEGPLAQAELEWERRQQQLNDLAARGEISQEQLTEALGFTAELRRRDVEAIEAQLTPYEQLIADLEAERALLGMSNTEREIANALRYAGVDAMSAEGVQIAENIRLLQEARERIQFSDDIRRGFEDTFASIIDGSKSAKDALADLGSYITQLIAQRLSEQLVDSLFGEPGTNLGSGVGGGIGGFLSSALSSLFGGGRAAGGWVSPGKMYEVAENGPELLRVGNRQFLLPTATGGMVTPNARMGGGGGVVQNITVQGRVDNRTASQLAQESARAQARARSRLGA
jgi:hypothetical protein